MWIALIVGLVTALGCDGKAAPAARGSLVFDAVPTSTADVFLATEAEILRSSPIRERVHQDRRVEVPADAIVVTRTPGTMILEVGVRDEDPRRAAEVCNTLIATYLSYRREKAVLEIQVQQQALAIQLEKHPDDARLQERLRELELARGMLKLDVRVLEPCVTASRR